MAPRPSRRSSTLLLVTGGLILATPGGGIVPLSQMQIMLLGFGILVPTVAIALMLIKRNGASEAVT